MDQRGGDADDGDADDADDFIMFITITACNGTSTGVSFVDLPHILAEAAKYVI